MSEVRQRGTDTSGRPIFASDFMWSWWLDVCADLGFTPQIVQGAWMSKVEGGGADASAGYHDQGGCFDLRTWDRTQNEVAKTVRTLRAFGAGAWLRDQQHGGFDPHIHFVLGADHPLAPGAASQWAAYLNGRDGLAGNGPDYHWRPDPLVTTPPEVDEMANYGEQLNRIEALAKKAAKGSYRRDTRLVKKLTSIGITTRQIEKALRELDEEVDE